MTSATISRPISFGVPAGSWAFGSRVWAAVVIALAASFWLELEAPSAAAITVAILAAPTRGQALEKAGYRLLATIIGVAAAIAIVGTFSQARDLLLVSFSAWLGLCVYVSGLLDGNRAYAAVLSGYTVALVAIQQLDTPQHVFETGLARGAAIAVGIAAIAVVNDLLAAPDSHPRFGSKLASLHGAVRAYARRVIQGEVTDHAIAAELLHGIVALRPEIATLSTESASGPMRSAAARSAAVALVAELHAVRIVAALSIAPDPDSRQRTLAALDENDDRGKPPCAATRGAVAPGSPDRVSVALAWALNDVLRRDKAVQEGLAAFRSDTWPRCAWRTPLFRSHRIAAEAGLRAAMWLALASLFFVLASWSAADVALSLVVVVIGLGATMPDPSKFTVAAFIAAPISVLLAGLLEFVILDGATEFPLLALALGPFMVGATVLATLRHPLLAALGRLNLIFILAVFSPSNPQPYNPETFLFTALFVCAATALLFGAQRLIPPVSSERRLGWLVVSAKQEFDHVLSRRDQRLAPEEAMFRDATRIGRITEAAGEPHAAAIAQALAYFERAGVIRVANAIITSLKTHPLAHLADDARQALAARDASRLWQVADAVMAVDPPAREAAGALAAVAFVIDPARQGSGLVAQGAS